MIGGGAGIARQNDIEARQDVLVYTTPSLPQDVEVTGAISLYVSTTAPNTDFTAKLVDVHQAGGFKPLRVVKIRGKEHVKGSTVRNLLEEVPG
jgi:predicted acyl esterase